MDAPGRGIILLQFAVVFFFTSCTFGDEPSVCPYNVRLEYWYAGSSLENMLPTYVDNLRQYIYDADGRLISSETLRGDSLTGWNGNLPPGSYTFVLWGNLSSEPYTTEVVQIKSETYIQDMQLSARQEGVPPGFRENTSRLYFASARFEVEGGVTEHRRIYLSHAHAALSVTVRWMTERPRDGLFRMRLKGVPALYDFAGGTDYPVAAGDGVYTLPAMGAGVVYHETRAAMNYDNEVMGQFVTFRYTTDSHVLWSLWRDGEQIIRDLDFYSFFHDRLNLDLDRNMEQEFDLLVTVYDDRIVVSQMDATDWDEGGVIG